jgi:hypothetical protein
VNAIIAITRREIADKKFVLIAAVAFGFLPFLLQALPGSHVGRLGVVTMSTIFAAGFAGGLAMILGATFIGGDISNGRMSFYFSRPIAAPAIWFGKLTAAVVILLATFFIIFAPGLLFSSNGSVAWSQAFPTELGATVATALACCLALLLLAHVVGTFVRSRSAWIAIDFAIAVILGVASFAMLRPLFLGQATELFTWLLGALLIGITVSIIGAGAFQLARGRTDRVRSHLALSQSLWSALLVVVALAGAFVWWVMSATPGDITKRGLAEQSPSGNLMILSGLVRGRADYHAVFLMDPVSGAFERIRPANFYSAEFVAGGTKLVEVERASVADGVADVYLRDAVPNGPRFDPHITVTARGDWRIAVSDDARQMAVADQGNLTVYDISSRRALGSVQIDPALGRMDSMYFAARDVVRMDFVLDQEKIPQTHDRTISIVEFDTAQRKLTRTGGVQTTGRFVRLGVSPDGSRMVLRTDHSLSIHDARTGALVSSPLLSPSELGYATTFPARRRRCRGDPQRAAIGDPRLQCRWDRASLDPHRTVRAGLADSRDCAGPARRRLLAGWRDVESLGEPFGRPHDGAGSSAATGSAACLR